MDSFIDLTVFIFDLLLTAIFLQHLITQIIDQCIDAEILFLAVLEIDQLIIGIIFVIKTYTVIVDIALGLDIFNQFDDIVLIDLFRFLDGIAVLVQIGIQFVHQARKIIISFHINQRRVRDEIFHITAGRFDQDIFRSVHDIFILKFFLDRFFFNYRLFHFLRYRLIDDIYYLTQFVFIGHDLTEDQIEFLIGNTDFLILCFLITASADVFDDAVEEFVFFGT